MFKIALFLVVSFVCLNVLEGVNKRPRRRYMSRYAIEKLKGPNVCAVEEVLGTRKRYYSSCTPRYPRKICGRKTFIRYHCCTGFEKTEDNEEGCMGVVPIRDIMTTVQERHNNDFVNAAQSSGLEDKLSEPGPYTLFLPHRTAFKDLNSDTRMLMGTTDQSKNLLRMHIAEGRYYARELINGMELPSIYYYQDEGLLKVHKYRNGVQTVNCVRIIHTDDIATNGIIHTTEKIIQPYPNRGTLMDVLLRDDRFGELATALIVTDLANELRDGSGHYTLFAPTDEAFRNAPQEIIERILSDKELVKKVLRYHQTNNVICSASVLGFTRVRSDEGQLLNLTCDIDDRIRVNDIPVEESDIVAFNGVIHVINELLIPDSVKSLGNMIDELDMGKFIEYAQQAGLQDILNADAPGNYTVFVPTSKAFNELSEDVMMKLQTDSNFVKETFRYHVVPESVTTHQMNAGQALDTLSQTPLRVSVYQKKYGVNSALITNPNHEVQNGVVHMVDKVLFPPRMSAFEVIKQDPRFSTFQSLLETSGLDKELERPGHYTIFAPTNKAIDRLPRRVLERITSDDQELKEALGYHILHKAVFTDGLRPGLQYRFNSLSDEWVRLKVKDDETPMLINNRVYVKEGDIESTSGVIHIIDEVLQCPCLPDFNRL